MHSCDEHLGAHDHQAMFCPVAIDRQPVLPGCNRSELRGYVCGDEDAPGSATECRRLTGSCPRGTTS